MLWGLKTNTQYNTSNQEHYTDNGKSILETVRLVHMHSNHPQSATVADDQIILYNSPFAVSLTPPRTVFLLKSCLCDAQLAKGVHVQHLCRPAA